MGDLSKNFSRAEFACKCGCGLDKIDPDFIANLQHSRDKVGILYVIASGCRCTKWNRQEGGVSGITFATSSAHTIRENGFCGAVDITCFDMGSRKMILKDVCNRFRHIGVHKNFIHVDNDSTKPEGVYLY